MVQIRCLFCLTDGSAVSCTLFKTPIYFFLVTEALFKYLFILQYSNSSHKTTYFLLSTISFTSITKRFNFCKAKLFSWFEQKTTILKAHGNLQQIFKNISLIQTGATNLDPVYSALNVYHIETFTYSCRHYMRHSIHALKYFNLFAHVNTSCNANITKLCT